ncbi:MAG: tetratricopeptide (TPR) repeat protein [Saprospiraceae bacterium]|jgi:tetratricopeptide (TPR) repeat protein
MKKVLLGIFSLLLISFSLVAQVEPAKALKKATKAYSAFNLDPTSNADKLLEAKDMIKLALSSDEVAATSKAWQAQGEIYSTSVGQDLGMILVKPDHQITDVNGATIANEAFMMAAKKAVKKYETKDAMDGLRTNISNLSNVGIIQYKAQKYAQAYANFNGVMNAHKALKEGGVESPLDGKEEYNNALYLAALGAQGAGEADAASKMFDELAAENYSDAAVYDGIYKANIDSNPEKAIAALEKGRKLFPENTSLLFTEINYYLRENRLDELTTKLKVAIAQEADNVTLYSTLGNVYDNLFQRENKAGNTEKEKEYFDLALDYYNQALKIDPSYSDATYSIGALYYNSAAAMTVELQDLQEDYSKAGIAKYKTKQAEITAIFDQALPYFEQADVANPNDSNTLIALKEIYAKKDDIVKSNEYKARLGALQEAGN